jgi:hypothetical protein
MDLAKAVGESKAGKVEYRTDRTAIVHLVIGKASFEDPKLLENYATVIEELIRAKPAAAKGRYLRTITLATTMGPGVKVDPAAKAASIREMIEQAPAAGAAACRAQPAERAARANALDCGRQPRRPRPPAAKTSISPGQVAAMRSGSRRASSLTARRPSDQESDGAE